jgi:hypothetical protein
MLVWNVGDAAGFSDGAISVSLNVVNCPGVTLVSMTNATNLTAESV